ncbi:aminodeoxychorismate/anthranilate synthase component II, partial [Candidatus Peregrinibacteria bacterium CG11_big_fil_rev_8_21_14_0_20_46_8]
MKTLIIDNYDSFTYILSQYVSELEKIPLVVKNNAITADEILNDGISHIIISPGPGRPEVAEDMGNCIDIIKKCMGRLPILGVCLGHQAIVHALGGKIVRAPQPVHGKKSRV